MVSMKKCNICGEEVEEKMRFCPYCGKSSFSIVNNKYSANDYENNVYNSDNYNQINYNQVNYDEENSFYNKKKSIPFNSRINGNEENNAYSKENRASFAGLVALAALIMAVMVFMFLPNGLNLGGYMRLGIQKLVYFDSKDKIGANNKKLDGTSAENYTKGEVEGQIYTNKWLGVKFNFPDGYSNASSDKYASMTNEKNDCAFYIENQEGYIIMGICEKASGKYSLEDYANILKKDYSQDSVRYTKKEEGTIVCANTEFKKIKFVASSGNVSIQQNLYITKKDNVFVTFVFTVAEDVDTDAMMQSIEEYN